MDSTARQFLQTTPARKQVPAKTLIEIVGPVRWATLHTRDWSDPVADLAWLKGEFALSLPCGTCRSDFLAYLREHPPQLDSPDAAFEWTVELHNAINAKLGKPNMSPEEAARIWNASQ